MAGSPGATHSEDSPALAVDSTAEEVASTAEEVASTEVAAVADSGSRRFNYGANKYEDN